MDEAVAGNLNQAQIQDLVGNAVGLDIARGDDITVARRWPSKATAADRAAAEELAAAEEAEQAGAAVVDGRRPGVTSTSASPGLGLVVWLRSRRVG
jgi:flagellar M-ring protein FliF